MDSLKARQHRLVPDSRRGILVAQAILATGCSLLSIFGSTVWMRAVGAFPLVLLLPGATLLTCVLVRRGHGGHDLWLLVPALSVVVTILGGLVLASLHMFNSVSLALLLGISSSVPAAWTAVTESRVGRVARLRRPTRRQIVTIVATSFVFVAVLGAALALAAVTEHRSALRSTTFALWVRPLPDGFRLGLTAAPRGQETVDVKVSKAGMQIAQWHAIRLSPGSQWSETIPTAYTGAAFGLPLVVRVMHAGRVVREIPVYPPSMSAGS